MPHWMDFNVCRVQKAPDVSFVCQMKGVKDVENSDYQVSRLGKIIEKCLSSSWSKYDLRSSVSFADRTSGYYINLFSDSSPMPTGAMRYYTSLNIYGRTPEAADNIPPSKPDGYCETLKLLIKAGDTGFSEIIGKNVGEGEWRSKVTLASWNQCRISSFGLYNTGDGKPNNQIYSDCEVGPFASKSAVEDMAKQVAADIEGSCLPNTWTVSKHRGPHDQLYIGFESADTVPTVEVRTYEDNHGVWNLRLDVDAYK